MSTNYPSSLVILESEKTPDERNSGHVLTSGVTTPSNGTPKALFQSFEGNGMAASGHACIDSTSCEEKIELSVTTSTYEKTTTDSYEIADSAISDETCSGNGTQGECDLNSVFIETSDFPLDLTEKTLTESATICSSGGVESQLCLGSNTLTSSASSDLSASGTAENGVELTKLKDLCSRARFARCRARFPIPVILYKQKKICR